MECETMSVKTYKEFKILQVAHLMKTSKVSPCIHCGKGTYSKYQVCVPCGVHKKDTCILLSVID